MTGLKRTPMQGRGARTKGGAAEREVVELAKPGPKPRPLADRFADYTNKGAGCWEWTGTIDAYGYGALRVRGSRNGSLKAHRLAWELYNGPIPVGMSVLHHCDNRKCVRPDHLFLGTQRQNMQDALNKGRHSSQVYRTSITVTCCVCGLTFDRWPSQLRYKTVTCSQACEGKRRRKVAA